MRTSLSLSLLFLASLGLVGCGGDDTPTSDTGTATSNDSADDETGYAAVSAGGEHNCALTSSGAIECYGGRDDEVSDAPTGTGYTAVDAGSAHTCALDSSGAIECWGENDEDQVSDAP